MSSQPGGYESAPAAGAPPALPPQTPPFVRLPKSPGLAAFLSLFENVGKVGLVQEQEA